ncbi:MAG: 2TM domain-containing protein, partial [Dolichospermum sp.]
FKSHLFAFMAINGFLVLLNLGVSPGYFWAIYPMLGWGLGLLLHGIKVYTSNS